MWLSQSKSFSWNHIYFSCIERLVWSTFDVITMESIWYCTAFTTSSVHTSNSQMSIRCWWYSYLLMTSRSWFIWRACSFHSYSFGRGIKTRWVSHRHSFWWWYWKCCSQGKNKEYIWPSRSKAVWMSTFHYPRKKMCSSWTVNKREQKCPPSSLRLGISITWWFPSAWLYVKWRDC